VVGTSGVRDEVCLNWGRMRPKNPVFECCDVDLNGRRYVVDDRRRSPVCGNLR
jgi:hypothetical protein